MKKLLIISIALVMAITTMAQEEQKVFKQKVEGVDDATLFKKAVKVLALEGYSISNSDAENGIITTNGRQLTLKKEDCSCKVKAKGIDYIRDKRTVTTVTVSIIISEGEVIVKTAIAGEYLKGDAADGRTMECISKGTIENKLLSAICEP